MSADPVLSLVCKVQGLHTSDINSCCFAPDGKQFATASSDRSAVLMRCDTSGAAQLASSVSASDASAVRQLVGHKYHVNTCRFSPCGTLLATGSTDCGIRVWDVTTGECIASVSGNHRGAVRCLSFSADGTHILSSASDDSLSVLNIASSAAVKTWKTSTEGALKCCDWTSHGWQVVLGSSSGHIMVWDAFDRRLVSQVANAHDLGVCCLVPYVTDAEYIASGGMDNRIRIWKLNNLSGSVQLQPIKVITGHAAAVYSLAVSPDKSFLLSGSSDRTLRLWSLETGKEVSQGSSHLGFVSGCGFSPCGRFVITTGGDRIVCLWKLAQCDGSLAPSALQADDATKMPEGSAESWGVDEVCQWLASLKLGQHAAAFRTSKVDGSALRSLHVQQLCKSFNMEKPSERHTVLCSLSDLFPRSRSVPNEFLCPIAMEIMQDPVVASDGFSYERSAIVSWITSGRHTSPLTNLPLTSSLVFANNNLMAIIRSHLEQ